MWIAGRKTSPVPVPVGAKHAHVTAPVTMRKVEGDARA